MTSDLGGIPSGQFSHDLLLHDGEDQLVDGARAFVDRGLASGGKVIVHGPDERVARLRDALGSHPRLRYGPTRDLFRCSIGALFAAQLRLAQSPEPRGLWALGIVSPCEACAPGASWARFESLVNEVLGDYDFHSLCACDVRTLPAPLLDVGRATHPHVSNGAARATNPEYRHPADFLADPIAAGPEPPEVEPVVTAHLYDLREVSRVRHLVEGHALRSAVPRAATEGLVTALNEVLVNALTHGAAPAHLSLWVEDSKLTCQVVDSGPGTPEPLAGVRYPTPSGPLGLWVARQSCEDVVIRNLPGGGCSVLLLAA